MSFKEDAGIFPNTMSMPMSPMSNPHSGAIMTMPTIQRPPMSPITPGSAMTPGEKERFETMQLQYLNMSQNGYNPPTKSDEKLPFQEFQQVLSFLASIGLATSASCSFSLIGCQTLFGDSSQASLDALSRSANLLAWSASCFIIALVFIVAPQLLYTELVIVQIIREKQIRSWSKRLVRVSVGVFAWIPLMFQVAAMYLIAESLRIFPSRAGLMARYGITGGVAVVGVVTAVGIFSEVEGRRKLLAGITCGWWKSPFEPKDDSQTD